MDITIELENKKIKIVSSLISLMSSYRQLDRKVYEAGGIMIGRENKETGNLIIEYATTPHEKDKRTRTSFYRKDKQHVEFYNKLYNENNGIYAYIGEWHTHPEDYPNYSFMDIMNWRKISRLNEDKERIYYHLIVGNKEFRIWEYKNTLKGGKIIYKKDWGELLGYTTNNIKL